MIRADNGGEVIACRVLAVHRVLIGIIIFRTRRVFHAPKCILEPTLVSLMTHELCGNLNSVHKVAPLRPKFHQGSF